MRAADYLFGLHRWIRTDSGRMPRTDAKAEATEAGLTSANAPSTGLEREVRTRPLPLHGSLPQR